MILKSSICGAYRRCIHKGWCIRRVMSEDNNETCGEGQHDWIYENGDDGVYCYQCEAEAIDYTIEPDGYVSDGEWITDLHITVETHTHQLDDALKAAREAPKAQGIVWDNLEPIDHNLNTGPAPKITTAEPTLKFRIECDETDTVYEEYEE